MANATLNEVYCITCDRIHPFTFQGVDYRFINASEVFGKSRATRQGISVTVTDRERTFLDCIRRPELAGGLDEMLRLCTARTDKNAVARPDEINRLGRGPDPVLVLLLPV